MRTGWPALTRALPPALATGVLVATLYGVSRWHYLLFHSIIELLGVVASLGIFMVSWNTRRTHRTGFLLFLGQAYLFIAALDLLHALAYKGMGVFPGGGANLPTQLWIAARAFESVALLIAPLFVARAVPLARTMLGSGAVSGALAAAIFSGRFPACFVDGQGLTGFKIGSEYAIVLTLAGALLLLARRRGCFEPPVFRALALSLVFKIGTEVSFTLYTDVYGFSNLIGHLLKLVSIALIYRALVETAIARPFELLFRELKHSEAALQAENIELAQAQEALRRKNEELAALIAEKNELLGIAAHDIRSPLAAIGMYATLLSRTLAARGDAEGLRLLAVIRRTNDRAFAMVSNVLDMTAIESGRLRLEARSHDLRRLVEEILEVQRSLAQGKGIEIDFECEEVAPACVDPARFEQVLSNLLSNALKFSPAGTRVTVRLFGRDGRAAVSVHDQGIGIAPESLGRIFLPFATAAAEGTAGERSTGLGLAIVKKIVESHGGRIEVDSAVGGGSTFTALFPLAPPESGGGGGASGRDERM